MRKLVPLLLLALVATVSAYGHTDAIITLERGKLKGLPQKYQPATLSISDRKLQVGRLSVTIPPCVWQHFSAAKESEFQFAASWYHNSASLPPYMWMSVIDAKTKTEVRFMINLDTLMPMERFFRDDLAIEGSCRAQWVVKSSK